MIRFITVLVRRILHYINIHIIIKVVTRGRGAPRLAVEHSGLRPHETLMRTLDGHDLSMGVSFISFTVIVPSQLKASADGRVGRHR